MGIQQSAENTFSESDAELEDLDGPSEAEAEGEEEEGGIDEEGGSEGSGTNPNSAPKYRALSDLEDVDDFTPEEAKRVKLAALHGFKTDAEIDAFLNKGKAPKKAEGKAKATAERPETDEEGEDADEDSEEAEDSEDDEDADESDLKKGKKSSENGPNKDLESVLKAISPNIKSAEDAVKSIQNLRSAYQEKAREASTLKAEVEKAASIDQTLEQELQTEEGVRRLLDLYKSPLAKAWKGSAKADSASLQDPDLDTMAEDDYLTGRQAKAVLARQVKAIQDAAQARIDQMQADWEEKQKGLREYLEKEKRTQTMRQQRMAAFRDFETVAKEMSEFDANYRLNDPAEKVWRESVYEYEDENGTPRFELKAQKHPEWNRLNAIMEARKEYLRSGAATIQDYLLRQFHSRGGLAKIKAEAAQKARQSAVDSRLARIQPTLTSGKSASSGSSFRPLSEDEFDALSPKQQAEYSAKLLKRVRRGEIRVKSVTD